MKMSGPRKFCGAERTELGLRKRGGIALMRAHSGRLTIGLDLRRHFKQVESHSVSRWGGGWTEQRKSEPVQDAALNI